LTGIIEVILLWKRDTCLCFNHFTAQNKPFSLINKCIY